MGSYFYNRDLLGDKFVENLSKFYLKDLISHGTPVHWFFKVVCPLFFHASYVFQDVLLLVLLFLVTKKLLFPVHPFQFQLLWNRYKNTDALQLLWNRYKNTDALQTIVVEVNQ